MFCCFVNICYYLSRYLTLFLQTSYSQYTYLVPLCNVQGRQRVVISISYVHFITYTLPININNMEKDKAMPTALTKLKATSNDILNNNINNIN